MIKKIVIIGPESTGKSTLCAQLAKHYKTLWVPEYAREYLEKNGTNYTYENLLTIAKGQVALEDNAFTESEIGFASGGRNSEIPSFLFIDTDMQVTKVWCEFVFDKCHNWILNQIVKRSYDLYLLCNIDLPWVKDNLREYPDLDTRTKLYHHYKDIMINQAISWVDISGGYEQRLSKAIIAVDSVSLKSL